MQELEVKILEVNRPQVEERLAALGATKSFDGEMLAIFFDWEDGKIGQAGEVFRLRREGENAVLTYKRPISKEGAKIMEEYETEINDLVQMRAILDILGLKVVKKTRKFRTQYELGDTHVLFDHYQDEMAQIPVFLEIEAPNMERLYETVESLGFKVSDCKSWHTGDLIRHYGLVV
ncbi:MAG: class IV adenylate cyclase [Bacteroidota bacterium]